jgi:hypothetical protein
MKQHHSIAFHTDEAAACLKRARANHSLADLHDTGNPKMAAEHRTIAECEATSAEGHIRMCKALSANSNQDDIDSTKPGSERGGDNPGGPRKAYGIGESTDLTKTHPFGIRAMRDADKVVPTEVRGVVPSVPNLQLVPRAGGKPVDSIEDSTSVLDSFKK